MARQSSLTGERRQFIKQLTTYSLCNMLPLDCLKYMNPKGVTVRSSPYPVNETMDRLQAFVQKRGATIYVRIDQQAELQNVGQRISPLEYLLFGNPSVGGPIMAANPVAALDLPLKVIVWEDDQAKVWIAYNEATYLEDRYSLMPNPRKPLQLDRLIDEALT